MSLEVFLGDVQTSAIMNIALVNEEVREAFPALNVKLLLPFSFFEKLIKHRSSVFKKSLKCTTERARQQGKRIRALRKAALAATLQIAVPHIKHQLVGQAYRHSKTYLPFACSERIIQFEALYLKVR